MLFKSVPPRAEHFLLVLFALLAAPKADAKVVGGAFLQGTTLEDGTNSLKITAHKAIKWSSASLDSGVFTHSTANPTRLTIKEEGDYFIAFTAPLIEGTGINGGIRSSQEFVVFKNGEEVPEGTGSSTYLRHTSGHAESSGHVHFLLTGVESDDYVEVRTKRTTTNMTNDTLMQTTSLYVEKIDADRVVFSGTATRTVAGTNLNGNASPLQWTAGRKDAGFTHNSHETTLDTDGMYLVFANIPLKGASVRGSVALEVKLDGERIPGGLAQQGYIRNADGGTEASVHWAGLVLAMEGQKLTIDTLMKGGGGTITVPQGNTASIFIEKLADPTDLFNASATQVGNNADNWNPGAKTHIQWRPTPAIDENVYTHLADAGSNKIMIKKAGDYLLLYNDALKDGSARNNPRITVQVNDEDVAGAESKSHYNRRGSGHDESSTSMVFLLEGLSVDDAVTVSVQQEGAGGAVNDEVPALLTLLRRPKFVPPPNPVPTIQVAGDFKPPFDAVPLSISVTFQVDDVAKAVTEFDVNDVTVTGGTLSNFAGSGHTYTFTVIPSGEAGQIAVSIAAGSATDGTNDSFAGSLSFDYEKKIPERITRMKDVVGWWSFDDETATDNSGNENHGVHSNASIYNEDTPFGQGRSVNLNGNNFITVSDGGNQSTFDGGSAFSISAWVKGWPDGDWDPYVSKRGEGGQGWQIRRRGNTADQITLTLRGPGNDDWPVNRNINDDKWHHLVGTFGEGKRAVYVDGQQVGSENRPGNVNATGSVLVFGARDDSGNSNNPPQIVGHSNVWLDDVRFYRVTLTADNVTTIYGDGEGDFNETPVITLIGDEHMRIEIGTDFADPGATAKDAEDGDLGEIAGQIIGDGDVLDTSVVGDWKIFYTVKDSAGDSASATRTVRVFDPSAPVLTLVGEAEITLEGGSEYVDAGVTVADSDGNALDSAGIVTTGIPDDKPVADFTVAYNFEDADGRAAEAITREVKVADTKPPVITLDGEAVIHHQVGTPFEDLGASAFDAVDGVVFVKDSLFFPNSLDLKGYQLGGRSDALLDFNDNSGVLSTPPVGLTTWTREIFLDGDGQFQAAIPQITKNDDYQVVFTGFFEAGLPGEYEFGIENPDDRGAFWIDLDQDDVFETVGSKGPEIMNNNWRGGYSTVNLEPGIYNVAIAHLEHGGGSRIDARFRAPTGAGPNQRTRINPSHPAQDGMWSTGVPVDDETEGTYTITYTAIDQAGNTGTVTRKVIVEHIAGSPIITLKGDPEITHEAGTPYEDPGARLRDSSGTPLDHSSIVTAGLPDVKTLGEYKVTYNYTDDKGKSASEVIRTVWVVDTAPPVITLEGEAELAVLEGADFTDPGVTAVDAQDGDTKVTMLSSNPLFAPGLMGGGLNGNMNRLEPNPGNLGMDPLGPTLSEVTTTPPWRDNYTIIYTGQIYDADGKVSFTENIDDIAWLRVNGEQVLDNSGWNQVSNGTFEAESGGWFDFELRMSNGGGGAGKVGDMGFGYDPEGGSDFILPRNNNENTADLFRYMEDPASFDTSVLGTHTLTYTASDSSGNDVSVTRTVIVKLDTSIPMITLEGGEEVNHEAGTDFVDPGYSIVDSEGNPLPDATATIGGALDINVLGSYTLTYDYTEDGGKQALQVSRTVRVVDTVGPVITLGGDNPMRILVDDEYTEPGVSGAQDLISGDAMETLKIQGPHIVDSEPGLVGEYFNFQQSGTFLFQDPTMRVPDVTRVESKLDFPSTGNPWAGLNNNFRDQFASRYTGLILIEEGGSYTFFTNSDDGSALWIGDRKLIENGGFHGMVEVSGKITLESGAYPIRVEFFEGGGGAGLQVSWQGPNIGKQIIPENVLLIPTYGLDTSSPGVFTVRYTARDALGNIGSTLRTVEVVLDQSAPSIVLLGDPEVTIEVDEEYTDAGGNIIDMNGVLIEGKKAVVDTDDLNNRKPGSYTVNLNYTDAAGKKAAPLTRTVHVVDTTAPVLTVNGDAVLKLMVGDTFDHLSDPGAKFTDNVDAERDVYYSMPPSAIRGLVLHLDADSLGEIYTDGAVMDNGWPDLSGKGNDASNVRGDPTWKSGGLEGSSTVNFDGDDMIWTSKDFESDLASYTILTVARYTGGDNERVISTRGRNWLFGFWGNGVNKWHADGWISNLGGTDTQWHLHIGDINNKAQANFWRDGVQLATNAYGANPNTYKPRVIQLGGWEADGEMSRCEVSEVILFDRVLSEREHQGLSLHLQGKYSFNFGTKQLVDTSQPGTHEITYFATDSSGNIGTAIRTIVVEADNDPPVISLEGDAVVYVTIGAEFIDPGATATDRGEDVGVTKSTDFPREELLALYAFEDAADLGRDISGNNARAQVRGDAKSIAQGRYGSAIELNGSDVVLITPLDGHYNVDFSWAAWVKTTDGNGGIVSVSNDNWSQGGNGIYVSGGRPKIDVGWVGNGIGTAVLNDGEWHHVALTVKESGGNSDPYVIYVDGEVDRAANIDWYRFDGTGHDLRIGHVGINDGQFLSGMMDDVVIYQRVLTQEEIRGIMLGASILDTNTKGAYPVTYSATDLAGNTSSVTRLVLVTDDPDIPYLTVNGAVEITLELGQEYSDAGAKAYDKTGKFLTDVTATMDPTNLKVGDKVLVQGDDDGLFDERATIASLGNDETEVVINYDDGVTLGETIDRKLLRLLVTNPLDFEVPGTFEFSYVYRDSNGKDALPVMRTVHMLDTIAPVVALKESTEFGGTDVVTLKAGQAFEDPGIDIIDADAAVETTVMDQLVPEAWFTFDDVSDPGYDITDNGYNGVFYNNAASTEKGRYGAGITIPQFDANARFELLGNGVTLGAEWTASAWFKNLYPTGRWRTLFRGRNTDHQVIVANNSDLLGMYANGRGDFRTSGYNLTPAATTEWRHIAAVGKGNQTHLYLDGQHVGSSDQKGTNTIWRIGSWPGNQHFSKYIDDVMIFDRALSGSEIGIVMNGNRKLDTNNPGTYSIVYTVTDSSGNRTGIMRTIIVEEDNSAPVITLLGSSHVSHDAGIEYVDSGAFVSTADGEPLPTDGLKIETDIDLTKLGIYTYTYTYTNEEGSVAIPVTRTVEIVDTIAPVLTIIGANPMTLPRGEVFDDPGALAEDNLDGVIPVRVDGLAEPYVQFDIGSNGQRVREGWVGISGADANQNNIPVQPTEVVTPDGHTFTVQISSVDWRDRGDSASAAPLAEVAEDFVKQNGGDITLTLAGLPAGNYIFTSYHLDVQFTQCAQINVHVTDANGEDVLQDVHGNANLNVDTINGISEDNFANTSATFKVKSNGLDPVIIRLDGVGADTEVPLNGLVIAKPLVISALGEYTIIYTAVDAHGHKAEATRTVIVSDDATIPSITLVGEKEISLEGGTDFEDPGVTLKDRDGNDLDAALVQVSGKVLTRTPGTYALAYDYSDADGKSAVTRKRIITVADTIAPGITLEGPSTVTHVLGEPYVDAGATAVDTVDGAVEVFDTLNFHSTGLIARWTFDEVLDGKVVDLAGGREGTLHGFDIAKDHIEGIRGKALNFDGTNNRIDVPPFDRNRKETSIGVWLKRRNGNFSSIFHTKAWTSGDLHFIVQNDILFACNSMGQTAGGGGNDFRSIQQLTINEWVHVASTYSVPDHLVQIYLDGQLVRETSFTGNFNIRFKNGMHIGAGQNGNDRFFNGEMDDLVIYDRVLTPHQVQAVMNGGQAIDVSKEGQYTITFTAYDESGNKANATRTVIVTADPDAPVISLKGDAEIAHEAGNLFEDPGATVADKDGNSLDAATIVIGGEVQSDILGQYILTYDFTDAVGGKAMQIKRKVTVADTLAPEITLNGEKEMRIGINSKFSDPGATAKDLLDGDIQVQTTIPIPVDTSTVGDFVIIYTAKDAAGNKAEAKRTIKVLPDTTPPVITLVGEATVTVILDAEYDDEGAIAEDDIDGILTPFIEDSGTVDAVNTGKEGTYVLTYDVEDFSGNKAVQVTRTVIVSSADPFDDWLVDLPVEQRTPESDPDKDGVPNLLEYALGGDPAIADRAIFLPSFDASSGFLKLTYCHLKGSADPKLIYTPQITSTLKVAWSKDGLTIKGALQGISQDNLPDGKPFAQSRFARTTVTANTSMANAGSKQFLRLTVSRE